MGTRAVPLSGTSNRDRNNIFVKNVTTKIQFGLLFSGSDDDEPLSSPSLIFRKRRAVPAVSPMSP